MPYSTLPISLASMLLGPVLGITAAMVLDSNALIPLGAAAGVILTVVTLTRRWTQIEDQLAATNRQLSLVCDQLDRIKNVIVKLPCSNGDPECAAKIQTNLKELQKTLNPQCL